MPLYEYYCPKCPSKYELLRPMTRADEPGTCPNGHGASTRVLSVFAAVSKGGAGSFDANAMPSGGGCGCGGGGCGCGN